MSQKGRYVKKKAKSQGAGKKVILTVLCVFLFLIVAAGAGVFLFVNSKLNDMPPPAAYGNPGGYDPEDTGPVGFFEDDEVTETTAAAEVTTEPEVTEPDYGSTGKILNVLLIGQDSREGEASKLADSIILCTINRETKVVTLTSFLRDTFLKMPNYVDSRGTRHECGKQRINVNYALGYSWDGDLGAMKMLDQCLYENFGVEVDCNVEVSFEAFAKVVDALGGLDVELDDDEAWYLGEYLEYLPLDATAGEYHLDGEAALAYARMRHSSAGDSDIKRAGRQRAVIGMIVDKCRTASLTELNNLASEVMGMVLTDLEKSEILGYIVELLPMITSVSIESNQCPAPGTAWGREVDIFGDGTISNVLDLDLQKNREILQAIAEIDH